MDSAFSVWQHVMVTAALTKTLSHYSTTGPINLTACSIISHEICMSFSKILLTPGPGEVKEVCKNHHLQTWKFGPGILYFFSLFKMATQKQKTDGWVIWTLAHNPDHWMTKNHYFDSLVSEILTRCVIEGFVWTQPVHIHNYLMRGIQQRLWPWHTVQNPFPLLYSALEVSLGLNLWHRLILGYQPQWKQCCIRIWSNPGVPCLD